MQTDSIYFDHSQTFGEMPHNILLEKRKFLALRSLHFLVTGYLASRFSFVCIQGKFSSPFLMSSGVSQGSPLEPLFSVLLLMSYVPEFVCEFLFMLIIKKNILCNEVC